MLVKKARFALDFMPQERAEDSMLAKGEDKALSRTRGAALGNFNGAWRATKCNGEGRRVPPASG